MIKKWSFYTGLTVITVFLSSGFKPFNLETSPWFLINEDEGAHYLFPSEEQNEYTKLNIPFTGNFFIGFKEAIGYRESESKYKKVNSLGYMGKYQFGIETLKSVGVYNRSAFLNSPELQEKAFLALLAKNKWELKREIEKYEGTILNGIFVTESGILAAAHLGGAGSVKKYFKNKGKRNFRDAYGSSIKSYMKMFGGYDTSCIIADNNATAKNI
ncbi:peptidoglycan-binding protein LysM [Flavobacterium sp. GSP27]|uniref:peptidoglycan-binding protein LysM n=1 Tax=unclassified Flavobacterium TaxID=196869 RepID=UPI000F842C1C|nr:MULTISPECIES: peptidoglycan-binding protein LysM [unclassified Flavobacterium]RTY91129.1 peptidoglycan-binding protein LysM [Flavobacterium sp. RSP46]RTZ07258.1 peptidoglycan-binding protein LysM [Flavobacterium sp. GSP27]